MTIPRKTIALVADSFLGEYQTFIRTAVAACAKKNKLDFLYLVGREIDSHIANHRIQNRIFKLVSADKISGIIVLAGSLSNFCGPKRIAEFCKQYAPIPLCSIGIEIAGVPSILLKNQYFDQVVEHIAVVHQRRKFAFLGGPPSNLETQIRREAFLKVLHKLQIPFDPELETHGNFMTQNGVEGIQTLLATKKTFDALVVANDDMAIGAIAALQENGYNVPQDISVTGFDDVYEARFTHPKLTTMRQPFEDIGDLAVKILIEQMNNKSAPMITQIPPQLILRQSCGCTPGAIEQSPKYPADTTAIPPAEIQKVQLEAVLLSQTNLTDRAHGGWAKRLVDSLFDEINGEKGVFVRTLLTILDSANYDYWLIDELQNAVSSLRTHFQLDSNSNFEIENLWHKARVALFDVVARRHMDERLALIRTNNIMVVRSFENNPDTATRDKLLQGVIDELLTMGIKNAVVSIFKTDNYKLLECIVAIRNNIHITDQPMVYPAEWLIPSFMTQDAQQSYVVFLLSSANEPLGILALETGIADNYYEMLSEYTSSNLKLLAMYQTQHIHLQEEAKHHRRAMKLQNHQKTESLGVLAGGIAHDFNNMLSAMAGNLDIIHMDMDKNHSSMEPLQECRSVVKHATGLVRQLLAYSNHGKCAVTRTNINSVIAELKEFLTMSIPPSVALDFKLLQILPDVEADASQIQQIFVNLISNASEAIEESTHVNTTAPTIIVETDSAYLDAAYFEKTITRDPLPAGQYVIARICDNGVGIAGETFAHIFEPFFTTKIKGRGLGLTAVLGIIRGHRGSIHVTSQVGEGTCFEVAFPRLAAQSEEPRLPTQAPTQKGAGTILVADDEPAVLKAISRLLKKMGFSTLEVNNGQKAIDMVQDFPDIINCVILDITMPGTGGIAAMGEIRKINPDLPVVITSGYSQSQAIDTNSDIQPTAFLQKPYNMESLNRLIHEVLENNSK